MLFHQTLIPYCALRNYLNLRFSKAISREGFSSTIFAMGILGTTGVATGIALRFFRAFLTAPGFFGGLSSEEESVSVSETSKKFNYLINSIPLSKVLPNFAALSRLSLFLDLGFGRGASTIGWAYSDWTPLFITSRGTAYPLPSSPRSSTSARGADLPCFTVILLSAVVTLWYSDMFSLPGGIIDS